MRGDGYTPPASVPIGERRGDSGPARAIASRVSVPEIAGFTKREQQVLHLLARACDIKTIAAELGTMPSTVATQIESIRCRIGIGRDSGGRKLMLYAVRWADAQGAA